MKIIGKRKRSSGTSGSQDNSGRRRSPSPAAAGAEPSDVRVAGVNDAEVEEFFAILRRMHDASRSVAASGCCSSREAKQAAAAHRWRPSFAWEDFYSIAKSNGSRGEAKPALAPALVGERSGESVVVVAPPTRMIDLNVEPESEKESEGQPSVVQCASARTLL